MPPRLWPTTAAWALAPRRTPQVIASQQGEILWVSGQRAGHPEDVVDRAGDDLQVQAVAP